MFRPLRPTVALIGLATALALTGSSARADIQYTYTRPLTLFNGTDTAGLVGGTAVLTFTVPTGATYINRFGSPAVPVVNPTLTISGASQAANNATFPLPAMAFYPSFAGFFTEPGGLHAGISLNVGGIFTLTGNTVPTATGALVNIGNTVAASHFGPASVDGAALWSTGSGQYAATGTVITVQEINGAAAPEPTTGALVGVLGIAGLALGRRRR